MDFAKEQLTKHGWKDGSGLGKTESGIKEAIKVKIKNDTKGVGHDAGAEFTFHWWDHVFNKAASSIQVQVTEDGVEVKKTGTTERVKHKRQKTYDNKAMLYGQFVKGSTLSGGTETEEPKSKEQENNDDDKHDKPVLMPGNEDEIFKQCGGRTAHKGARHGLKLNGKLYRIEQQEKLLLEKMNSTSTANKTEEQQEEDNLKKKKKKKKKKKNKDLIEETENSINETPTLQASEDGSKKSKKSKKKKKQDIECAVIKDEGNEKIEEDVDINKGKRKSENLDLDKNDDNERTVKKKKKKKSKDRD